MSRSSLARLALALLAALCWVCTGTSAEEAKGVRELLAADDWLAALEHARAEFERHPAEARAQADLGLALLRAGYLRQAESMLSEAVEASGDPRATVGLGRIMAASGRPGEAIELMERAVKAAPDDPYVFLWASHAPPSRGRAVEWLERYRELADPSEAERLEAIRGTLELFKALGERRTWIADKPPKRVELGLSVLGSAGNVTGLILKARLDGRKRPVRLLLDSGSPGLVLMERVVPDDAFEAITRETSFGGGGAQRHEVARGLLSSVAFEDLVYRDAVVTTTDYELDPFGRYHGVIGLSVFDGYHVTIEPRRKRVILELREGGEPETGDRYWDFSGQMLVEVRVGEDHGLFLFDTGASNTLVAQTLVERLEGVTRHGNTTVMGFGGVREGTTTVRGVNIDFQGLGNRGGPLAATDLTVRSRIGGVEVAGFLGLDLLGHRRIVVDTVARRVRVEGD